MLRRELALEQPDLGVLRKAQKGDERAFSIIVRAYERPVYNYVLRLVGDRALAEDLTQESFLRVYQGSAYVCPLSPKTSIVSSIPPGLFQLLSTMPMAPLSNSMIVIASSSP